MDLAELYAFVNACTHKIPMHTNLSFIWEMGSSVAVLAELLLRSPRKSFIDNIKKKESVEKYPKNS